MVIESVLDTIIRGAESSVPREPRTAKGKPDRKGILLPMTVLSGRVSECPTGNLSVISPAKAPATGELGSC